MNPFEYDFGYTWPWTHGHLIPFGIFALLAFTSWRRNWPRWTAILGGSLSLWALAGFLIVQFAFRFNLPLQLPAGQFLTGESKRVLDIGAGSGRATLMVLLARPDSRVVALDKFSEGYGIGGNRPDRLLANARMAGAEERLEVVPGDMREMPLENAAFDGAVSAFAIDHLNAEGIKQALAEVTRVLRPGGEFLLVVINPDGWIRFAYPMFPEHGYFGGTSVPERWRSALTEAGLEVVGEGRQPGALYFLSRSGARVVKSVDSAR
jgi:SAM-dependent methyltransferase